MSKREKPQHCVSESRNGAKRKRKNQPVRTRKGANGSSPGKPENLTPKRWEKYLAAVSNGARHTEAATAAEVTSQTVDAYLISNVAATTQLRDAKLIYNRRHWPMEKIEEVLEQIAIGKTLKQAFNYLGIDHKHRANLYKVLLQDKAVRKLYDDARNLQMETFSDEIIEIADDTDGDFDDEGKANHELVNRSRVRIDTRKFLMGTIHSKRFGSTKHHVHEGELNINHAAVLSGGRKRLERLHAERKGQTIEGESEVVGNE